MALGADCSVPRLWLCIARELYAIQLTGPIPLELGRLTRLANL